MIKLKASRARHVSINNNNIIGEPTNGKDIDSQSFTLHSNNSCELLFHIIERCSSLVVPHYLFIHKSKTRTRWIPLAMSDPRKFGMRPPNNSSEINFRHYLFSPRPGQELYCCSGYAMSIQQVISIIILFIHKAYIIWDEIILSWPEIITVSGARAFLLGVVDGSNNSRKIRNKQICERFSNTWYWVVFAEWKKDNIKLNQLGRWGSRTSREE